MTQLAADPGVPSEFEAFRRHTYRLTGVDLTSYKAPQMYRRLSALLARLRIDSFAEYARVLEKDAVRRQELRRREPGMGIADPRQDVALVIEDAEPRPQIGSVAVDRHRRAELTDITERMVAVGHEQPARAVQVVPLRLVPAMAVEYLHAMVLAVRHIDPAVGVGRDVVHDVELARAAARLAPRQQQFAVGREFVNAGVAVAVGDIDLALRRQGSVRAAVERLAAHIGRGLSGNADFQ